MITTLIVLVLFGLLLIMLEAFVPGGILGTFGVISILSAVAVTLFSDEVDWTSGTRTTVSLGIIVTSAFAIAIWLRFFAVKLFHRAFTLKTTIATPLSPGTPHIGVQGVATTDLRPLGKVSLDNGTRHEVRLLNGHAPIGTRIQVITTEPGNLVVTTV
jgi:membrane-bound ClpP family serine protease